MVFPNLWCNYKQQQASRIGFTPSALIKTTSNRNLSLLSPNSNNKKYKIYTSLTRFAVLASEEGKEPYESELNNYDDIHNAINQFNISNINNFSSFNNTLVIHSDCVMFYSLFVSSLFVNVIFVFYMITRYSEQVNTDIRIAGIMK